MNILAIALIATTTVFRLELTDEKPYIVGADGLKREVVIMEPEQYSLLTGQVQKIWTSMNATSNDRHKLHGKCVTTVTTNGNQKVTVERYDDGFVYTDRMTVRNREDIDKFRQTNRAAKSGRVMPKPKKPNSMSSRHWEMRQKLDKALRGEPKEVTVEHDATTGKDIVK